MNQEIKNTAMQQRTNKITWLFMLITLAMVFLLFSVFNIILSDRHIPSQHTTIHNRSFRGSIISADNYTLSHSYKTYQAVIRGESIDPKKKEIFITLFSIYSGIPKNEIRKRFKDQKGRQIKGNIVLSKTLNAKQAMQLKSLAYKFRRLKIFRSVKIHSGIEVLYGLDIIEIGESRQFPLHDTLSPVLGYVHKKNDEHYTRPQGKKGLERKYEKYIISKKDGYLRGKRDVGGNIIYDKNSIKQKRVNGMDLHLNISLAFQRHIEKMIDTMKKRIDAEEILIGVMESRTGKVLSLATTERYDPDHITQKDIPKLNLKFTEYPYEAGSVLKPITLAVAIDHKVVTPQTWFKTYNGRMKIGKQYTVTDDEKFDSLTATDIIVHSSNVGISQISWRLTGKEFRDGLLAFGFSRPSGIDLSRELSGRIKSLHLLNNKMHRANSAYGYGMLVTFAQLWKAYSAFNNGGIAVTPRIVNYLQDSIGRHFILSPSEGNLHPISKKTAQQIHEILKEVVKRGTGLKTQYLGLEIGGKTGTSHIAKHGHYTHEYHSSFYGFANDKKGHKYTIGILVIRAKGRYKYFASQSAVPTFKNVVRILVDQGYLKPDSTAEIEAKQDTPLYEDRESYIKVSEPILPPLPKEKTLPKIFKPKPQKTILIPKKIKLKPHKTSIIDMAEEAANMF
ncbi:MAG: penicillin-binding protein 2 [Sulfurovum sp.]|nr:penicillin-binding protein 2 [Sulfurovum sp.]